MLIANSYSARVNGLHPMIFEYLMIEVQAEILKGKIL